MQAGSAARWVCRNRFVVEDHEGGSFYFALEHDGEPLPVLGQGVLSFDLRYGVNVREAEALAERLNADLTGVAFTADA